MTVTYGYEPAKNKNGMSLGKFVDYDFKTVEGDAPNDKDVELRHYSFEKLELVFSVTAKIRNVEPKHIKLSLSPSLKSDSPLFITLTNMGFISPLLSEKNSVVDLDDDSDELEQIDIGEEDPHEKVHEFLDSIIGKQFWLKIVTVQGKNWLTIDYKTITPKV